MYNNLLHCVQPGPKMIKLLNSRDLKEGQPQGLRHQHTALLAIRCNGKASVYYNRCPHQGTHLDWQPDVFLNHSGEYIQCATHGALFELHSGKCIWGPCAGLSLQRVETQEFDGAIWLTAAKC